ncbi:MAG TPA: HAD family hydrolase [Thermoanaerobaculia bacterium]|jgi:phosphoglycolate phosphatase-like HAD superfamily hydrolase|nr:HAD family hydrolase [Thermoanaerobaculia bacterium]
MNIALFDIDGTLTESNETDSICFAEAFRDVFGAGIDTDWDSYQHTTDRGIVIEALQRLRGREAEPHEIALHRTRFVELLGERMTELHEVPGAGAFLAQLQARDWRVVLCTGAWSDSAKLKLMRAGLPADLPLASCDDGIAREDILRRGIALAGAGDGDVIVSFGDAPWDVRAAANLNLPFIGIAAGTRAGSLRRSGAAEVFDDFEDAAAVFAGIDRVTRH